MGMNVIGFFPQIFHPRADLIILDDVFPYLLSGFRIEEYNRYMQEFSSVKIYSFSAHFKKYRSEYIKVYPEFSKHVHRGCLEEKYRCSLFYTIFLNNIFHYLPIIEKQRTPFVFTLYPGGGFQVGNTRSDDMLSTVCGSPYLKKIIVTQRNTREYLREKRFCPEEKMEFIYGGVLPSDYYRENELPKKYYKKDKQTFDICFVANKYIDKGLDKGYDIFIDVAKILAKRTPDIRFHVVGSFDEQEVDVQGVRDQITFYGLRYKDFFPDFYSHMDIILSPNRPYVLTPGSFDGFPTGSCIEAGFAGVAVFCSDELNLNIRLKDEEEIRLIPLDPYRIAEIVLDYYMRPDALYRLARGCQARFYEIFGVQEQMGRRLNLMSECINQSKKEEI